MRHQEHTMKSLPALIAAVAVSAAAFCPMDAHAGAIFVTGHDPIWHSGFGSNAVGAANLARTGIEYARQGHSGKFLYIESRTASVPSGNAFTAGFLTSALGYSASSFDVMGASDLLGLSDFAATLAGYSAIVVASDHGGMLTAGELGFLNGHSADILNYLNAGGGLYAEAESNATGNIGALQRFGFLPFLVSSTDFQTGESGNTVTAFGAGLGLSDSDVNGNFSHNYFASTGGMTAVDLFNGQADVPLTLAYTGRIGVTGVQVPEPGTLALVLAAAAALALRRRRA
jgi:hypothetical protein